MLRVQVAQVVAGRLGRRQRLQHHLRIAQARLLIEVLADLRRIQAASACMPGILEGGEPQFDLCTGQRVRCRGALRELRQLEGRCRQSPVVGLADFSHGVAGLGREAITRHPKQGLGARGIERGERGTVRALDIALGRLGEQPAHLGEQRVDGRGRWRRIGDRRRGWRRGLLGRRWRRRQGGGLDCGRGGRRGGRFWGGWRWRRSSRCRRRRGRRNGACRYRCSRCRLRGGTRRSGSGSGRCRLRKGWYAGGQYEHKGGSEDGRGRAASSSQHPRISPNWRANLPTGGSPDQPRRPLDLGSRRDLAAGQQSSPAGDADGTRRH